MHVNPSSFELGTQEYVNVNDSLAMYRVYPFIPLAVICGIFLSTPIIF